MWLPRLYHAAKLSWRGAPRSLELFGKNSVWKVYNKSSLSLLHYPRQGLLLASLFLPLLLRFITSVSPNLGWWGGCCMTRHMSGPLREKAASLLLGLFSLRDHAPSPPRRRLCHSWHLPARRRPLHPAQLLPTLLMPSLAGMWLVYLLWPAACVKGAFWPHLGRGHLRLEGWLWDVGVCVRVCVWKWSLWGVGRKDEWLKKPGSVHVRDNMWLVHLSLCHPCLVRGKYVPLLLLLRNGMHRQVTQSLLSRLPSTESAREKGCRVIVTGYGDFAPSHWCIPLNAHANIPVTAHSLQPDSSIVFRERRGAIGWDYRKLQSRVWKSLEKYRD